MRMRRAFGLHLSFVVILLAGLASARSLPAGEGYLKNPSFEQMRKPEEARALIKEWREKGWKFASDELLPAWWGVNPMYKGTLEIVKGGAQNGNYFLRIGGAGHITGNFGEVTRGEPYIASVWLRGKGHFELCFYQYRKDPRHIFIGGFVPLKVDINTKNWTKFRGFYPNENPETVAFHVALVGKGKIEVDNLSIVRGTPAQALITKNMVHMYGKGILVENAAVVAVDEKVEKRLTEMEAALVALEKEGAGGEESLLEDFKEIAAKLRQMAQPGGRLLGDSYNEIVALAAAVKELAGRGAGVAPAAPPKQATQVKVYRAGIREPRPGTITITKARPRKILYAPGETAVVPIELVNTSESPFAGNLICTERRDIDEAREVARVKVSVGPKQKKTVTVRYNVGKEEFGRELAVRLEAKEKVADEWSEYYSVASDWIRVAAVCGYVPEGPHDHSRIAFYHNMGMTHGVMPDHTTDLAPKEDYWYGHYGKVTREGLRSSIRASQKLGIKRTCYTHTATFNGPAGLEFARRHPEWVKRDANGRFAPFEFYGGLTPSPLEIAAGPQQPQSRWMAVMTLMMDEKLIRTLAEELADSVDMFGWDGIMFDGPPALSRGCDYRGHKMPDGKDPVEISARNIRIYRDIVLKRHPDFKIWFNYGYRGTKRPFDHPFGAMGGERQFAECMATKDTGELLEMQKSFFDPKSETHYWEFCYKNLYLPERDNVVQRYRVPVLTGWMWQHIKGDEPGTHRWAWTATNHIGAILLATQMHPVTWASPAWRPIFQFMTRYSALLYAKDIVVVRNPEKFIEVESNRPLWWKEVVYERPAPGGGTDYIVHLINKPVTETIEFDNPADPPSATDTIITVKGKRVLHAWAVRPYQYDEPQQVLTRELTLKKAKGDIRVRIPPFQYYTMVVFRAGR